MSPGSNTKRHLDQSILNLYSRPIKSTRGGALYNAHSYATKINSEAIVPFILAHTDPGDTVFDGFAGTGATGLACALCSSKEAVSEDVLPDKVSRHAEWGKRRSILYDVGRLAAFISDNLLHPPSPDRFKDAAVDVQSELEDQYGWIYQAEDPEGNTGVIRHVVHSEHVKCPTCSTSYTYFSLVLDLDGPTMSDDVECPNCGTKFDVQEADRVTESYHDSLLNRKLKRRKRTPVLIYGRTGNYYWRRKPTEQDRERIQKIEDVSIPDTVPIVRIMGHSQDEWGEMHRAGYHFGMTHLHHFYTRRNLIAVGAAWKAASRYRGDLEKALRFWISSYNALHSTLMARVVCKSSADDLVVTGAQPGTLYVSSLPAEKNVFRGISRKQSAMERAFKKVADLDVNAEVRCSSSLDVDLPDQSVDYIFTDPPFGGNIQYSEINFISEAWIGDVTNADQEITVSSYQDKSIDDYEKLLAEAFKENHRILKPEGLMTVNFNSASSRVWKAAQEAWEEAGFHLERISLLDKTQKSFKQVTTEGAVKGDSLILLRKVSREEQLRLFTNSSNAPTDSVWDAIDHRLAEIDSRDDLGTDARTDQRLFGWLISHYLKNRKNPEIKAGTFFEELNRRYNSKNGHYYCS